MNCAIRADHCRCWINFHVFLFFFSSTWATTTVRIAPELRNYDAYYNGPMAHHNQQRESDHRKFIYGRIQCIKSRDGWYGIHPIHRQSIAPLGHCGYQGQTTINVPSYFSFVIAKIVIITRVYKSLFMGLFYATVSSDGSHNSNVEWDSLCCSR